MTENTATRLTDTPEKLAKQYGTETHLRTRIETHRLYTVGPDLEPAIDTVLALTDTEALLDVGTGPGDFPGRLRRAGHAGHLVGIDLSPGMVEKARAAHPDVEFLQGSADALPFPDATFDIVSARHMLYHVPDIPAALAEMRRVLRPGGTFLAVTNAADNMAAYWDAVEEATATDPELAAAIGGRLGLSFNDISGERYVREAFGEARVTALPSALRFPSPEPVLRYFDSCTTLYSGADETLWTRARTRLATVLAARFAASTPWEVPKTVVLIAATRR